MDTTLQTQAADTLEERPSTWTLVTGNEALK
jgi:hypothetical protein